MVFGIGTDLVEVARMATKIQKNNGFREQVFSKAEIGLCDKKGKSFESYAARFAAKEAFLKALGTGLDATYDLYQIEILQQPNGHPFLQLSDSMKELMYKITKTEQVKLHVSLTHTDSFASAVVILEIQEK